MKVIFTPLAQRQLEKLHEDIVADASEERADGYISRIVDFCNGFTTFPDEAQSATIFYPACV